jgi:ATP-dependent DNA ligase
LRLYVTGIVATLILLGINLVIAIVLELFAAPSSPSHTEREALRVRREGLDGARGLYYGSCSSAEACGAQKAPRIFPLRAVTAGMSLDVPLTLEPMEAEAVDTLPPAGKGWQYEPKVDGFRCIIFRDGDQVHLQSRRQKPLERYFPEVAEATRTVEPVRFVLDGELVISDQPFDSLQLRLHPAASRIRKLSAEIPAQFVTFDLLADPNGHSLLQRPFVERRAALEAMFRPLRQHKTFLLSKATRSSATAHSWLSQVGRGLDGIVAKGSAEK